MDAAHFVQQGIGSEALYKCRAMGKKSQMPKSKPKKEEQSHEEETKDAKKLLEGKTDEEVFQLLAQKLKESGGARDKPSDGPDAFDVAYADCQKRAFAMEQVHEAFMALDSDTAEGKQKYFNIIMEMQQEPHKHGDTAQKVVQLGILKAMIHEHPSNQQLKEKYANLLAVTEHFFKLRGMFEKTHDMTEAKKEEMKDEEEAKEEIKGEPASSSSS